LGCGSAGGIKKKKRVGPREAMGDHLPTGR